MDIPWNSLTIKLSQYTQPIYFKQYKLLLFQFYYDYVKLQDKLLTILGIAKFFMHFLIL